MDQKESRRFAFIGCGNMAGAIIRALELAGVPHSSVWLNNRSPEKYKNFAPDYNIAADAAQAVSNAEVIFLCVKPQNFSEPLEVIRRAGISLSGKTVISVVTGISCARIAQAMGDENAAVIRTMPNTPLLAGLGVTAICRSSAVSDEVYGYVKALPSSVGEVLEIPENKMCDIIAETGSSPAYVYYFIKAMVDKAAEYGFDRADMTRAVCDTFIGAATLLRDGGRTPDEQIRMVTSPGGTTERAMRVFAQEGIGDIIARAMDACTDRAYELAGEPRAKSEDK
ncbi:MAG: pyrroline-5-carboxylate reductase [Eubacteriales bacterium]